MLAEFSSKETITFGKWWQLYEESLERLKPIVGSQPLNGFIISYQMIKLGKSLENNVFSGLSIKEELLEAEEKLGPKIELRDGHKKNLPDIYDAESYLFALNYYLHLCRFQRIHSSSRLLQFGAFGHPGIETLKAEYLKLAQHLEGMLLTFEKDFSHLLTRHKRLNTMSGNSYFEKGLSLIEAPKIAQQLADVLHLKCKVAANHFERQGNQELKELVRSLNQVMNKNRQTLQEIANLRLLMELNEVKNKAIVDYVRHPKDTEIRKRALSILENIDFPVEVLSHWDEVVSSLKKRSQLNKRVVQFTRGAGHATELAYNALSAFSQEPTNRKVNEEQNQDALSEEDGEQGQKRQENAFKKTQPSLVDSNCPPRQTELLSRRCIQECDKRIKSLSDSWSNEFSSVDKDALVGSRASDLKFLADKISLLQYLMNVQFCLAQFKERHNKGIVRFSNWSVFGVLSRWLSKTFFRSLLHDNLLLLYAAENLEKQLQEHIDSTNRISGSLTDLEDRITDTKELVCRTRRKAKTIKEKSLYCFFSQDIEAAHLDFNDALNALPDTIDDESPAPLISEHLNPQTQSPPQRAFSPVELGEGSGDEDSTSEILSPYRRA